MSENNSENLYALVLKLPLEVTAPDHYQLLGLERFTADEKAICNAAADQNGKLMSWQNADAYSSRVREMMLEVVQAKGVLLDPEKKRVYDQTLGQSIPETKAVEEGSFDLEGDPFDEEVEALDAEPQPLRLPPRQTRSRPRRRSQKKRGINRRWVWSLGGGILGLVLVFWFIFGSGPRETFEEAETNPDRDSERLSNASDPVAAETQVPKAPVAVKTQVPTPVAVETQEAKAPVVADTKVKKKPVETEAHVPKTPVVAETQGKKELVETLPSAAEMKPLFKAGVCTPIDFVFTKEPTGELEKKTRYLSDDEMSTLRKVDGDICVARWYFVVRVDEPAKYEIRITCRPTVGLITVFSPRNPAFQQRSANTSRTISINFDAQQSRYLVFVYPSGKLQIDAVSVKKKAQGI